MDNIELSTLDNTAVNQRDGLLFDSNVIDSNFDIATSPEVVSGNTDASVVWVDSENNNESSQSSNNGSRKISSSESNTTVVVDESNNNSDDSSTVIVEESNNNSNDNDNGDSNNNNNSDNNTTVVVDDDSSNNNSNDDSNTTIVNNDDSSSNSTIDAGIIEDNFAVVNTYDGDRDTYQFEIDRAGKYEIELGELNANLDLSIEDSEGNIVYASSESGNASELISEEFDSGNYTAYVAAGSDDAETSYSLTITQLSDDDSNGNDDNTGDDNEPILGQGDVVYRFLETEAQTQFYTTSEFERDSVRENLPNYEYIGESFIGAPNPDENDITGVTPVYRFFNKSTGVHLYTASEVERDFVTENLDNYTAEGVSYYGYESEQDNSVPLYRFYNQSLDAHFYTPSLEERDEFLADAAYQAEGGEDGIAFYVDPIEDI